MEEFLTAWHPELYSRSEIRNRMDTLVDSLTLGPQAVFTMTSTTCKDCIVRASDR